MFQPNKEVFIHSFFDLMERIMKIIIHAHASYSRKVTDIAATDKAPPRKDIGIHADRSGAHTRRLSKQGHRAIALHCVPTIFGVSLCMLGNFACFHDVA